MSLGAIPGTGPATSPMPIIRKSTARTMADLPSDRTLVMGILNINDDSFSDGGKYLLVDDAISHVGTFKNDYSLEALLIFRTHIFQGFNQRLEVPRMREIDVLNIGTEPVLLNIEIYQIEIIFFRKN